MYITHVPRTVCGIGYFLSVTPRERLGGTVKRLRAASCQNLLLTWYYLSKKKKD